MSTLVHLGVGCGPYTFDEFVSKLEDLGFRNNDVIEEFLNERGWNYQSYPEESRNYGLVVVGYFIPFSWRHFS